MNSEINSENSKINALIFSNVIAIEKNYNIKEIQMLKQKKSKNLSPPSEKLNDSFKNIMIINHDECHFEKTDDTFNSFDGKNLKLDELKYPNTDSHLSEEISNKNEINIVKYNNNSGISFELQKLINKMNENKELKRFKNAKLTNIKQNNPKLICDHYQDCKIKFYEEKLLMLNDEIYEDHYNMDLRNARLFVLRRLKKFHECLDEYDFLIDNNQENIKHIINKASCYKQMGYFYKSITYYEESLKLKPNNYFVYRKLLDLNFHLKYYSKCIEIFKDKYDILYNCDISLNLIGMSCFFLNEYHIAIQIFNSLIDNGSDYYEIYINKAESFYLMGDIKNAIKVIIEAEKKFNVNSEIIQIKEFYFKEFTESKDNENLIDKIVNNDHIGELTITNQIISKDSINDCKRKNS